MEKVAVKDIFAEARQSFSSHYWVWALVASGVGVLVWGMTSLL